MFKQTICKRLDKLEESVSCEDRLPEVRIDLRDEKKRIAENPRLLKKWLSYPENSHPSRLPDYL